MEVSITNAVGTIRQLGTNFGPWVGINSSANVLATRWLAEKIDGDIATVQPDKVEHYFRIALL